MVHLQSVLEKELATAPNPSRDQLGGVPRRTNRWNRRAPQESVEQASATTAGDTTSEANSDDSGSVNTSLSASLSPWLSPGEIHLRPANGPSYILQHYHATGRSGGAFSWRAAMMDPNKNLFLCTAPREYRETTMQDIMHSKRDKRRGGGPRVGPFQATIPGSGWQALPKYDFTSRNRSSAFNERMHVEWENHADHIIHNGGELPLASVVAKAGFRSCAPCCRDMLALARPTGKTFIMVDLAEDDKQGTFHFVAGDKYLPVPKEELQEHEVLALKEIVSNAQGGAYNSSQDIYDAVVDLGVPIDMMAQSFYLDDTALLPSGCAGELKGNALLDVLHAEHFARLAAEYGASILRDKNRPREQCDAIHECRAKAKQMVIAAWRPHLGASVVDLDSYATAATLPLLPDKPNCFSRNIRMRKHEVSHNSVPSVLDNEQRRWRPEGRARCHPEPQALTEARLQAIDEHVPDATISLALPGCRTWKKKSLLSDAGSTSTRTPDDNCSTLCDGEFGSDWEDPDQIL